MGKMFSTKKLLNLSIVITYNIPNIKLYYLISQHCYTLLDVLKIHFSINYKIKPSLGIKLASVKFN